MAEYGDNKNKIGITKGTEIEKEMQEQFECECKEVGMYLAIARLAEREGYPEIAEVLKSIAMDEAYHASRFAELNAIISENLVENIKNAIKGEMSSNKKKRELALKAKELNLDEAHDILDEASRDEHRHAEALKGILKRYFNEEL